MDKEKKSIKEQLDRELATTHFTKQQQVLEKARQSLPWRQRLQAFWNKELDIPVLPIGAIVLAFFLFLGTKDLGSQKNERPYKEIVSIGTYYYWIDDVGKLVNQDES